MINEEINKKIKIISNQHKEIDIAYTMFSGLLVINSKLRFIVTSYFIILGLISILGVSFISSIIVSAIFSIILCFFLLMGMSTFVIKDGDLYFKPYDEFTGTEIHNYVKDINNHFNFPVNKRVIKLINKQANKTVCEELAIKKELGLIVGGTDLIGSLSEVDN